MALTETEILTDLPALVNLYAKIKHTIDAPPADLVPPPTADPTDKALAVAQAVLPDVIALIRKIVAQSKD